MDPLFVASPTEAEIANALRLWPELSSKRVRPLLVSAFGDIFVETEAGDVWIVSPIDLSCEQIAGSVKELEQLFADSAWAQPRLLTEVALLARERGIERAPGQVFAIAPHPSFTGSLRVEQLMPMDLSVWHTIAVQLRTEESVKGI
jgi:hypothetical protein